MVSAPYRARMSNGLTVLPLRLRHLLAVLVEDQLVDQNVLVRRLVEQECADGVQRVEPSAGLVDPFADEIGRVLFAAVDQLLVLERIMPLGERHGTGVEPDVDQFRRAAHRTAA